MADSKITALTALTAADPINDVIPIVDVSDTSMAASGTTKKISVNNLLSSSPTASGALTVTGLVTAGSASITGDLTVDTSTLKVDSTNNRVGIGTSTPATTLDVNGGTGGIGGQTHATFSGTAGRGLVISTRSDSASADRSGVFDAPFTGGTLTFQTLSTDRMVIDASANVNITSGNVVMATSGKGIDFSATAGTGTSELLNDYEEGTFTPTISTGATAVTYDTQFGRYTKVGRLVTVYIQLTTLAATRNGSQFLIGGLPFASAIAGTGVIGYSNSGFVSTAGGNKPNMYVSGSAVEFYNSAGGSFAGTTIATDAFDVRFSATYFV